MKGIKEARWEAMAIIQARNDEAQMRGKVWKKKAPTATTREFIPVQILSQQIFF